MFQGSVLGLRALHECRLIPLLVCPANFVKRLKIHSGSKTKRVETTRSSSLSTSAVRCLGTAGLQAFNLRRSAFQRRASALPASWELRSGMEQAASRIHEEWMKRNPKGDWNAALHVPYEELPEDEKEKDRAHVRLVQRLLSEHSRHESENEEQHHSRIADVFGSLAHEDWRQGHEASKGVGAPRMKDVSDGPQVNINVPWEQLHPEWKKENLEAGHAAVAAVSSSFKA